MPEKFVPVIANEYLSLFIPVRWFEGIGHEQPFAHNDQAHTENISPYMTALLCMLTFLISSVASVTIYANFVNYSPDQMETVETPKHHSPESDNEVQELLRRRKKKN